MLTKESGLSEEDKREKKLEWPSALIVNAK